jgi:hypothetical protein
MHLQDNPQLIAPAPHAPGRCALVQALDGDFQSLHDNTVKATSEAKETAAAANWKMNLLLGMCGSMIVFAVAAFVWLFTQQQHANAAAADVAKTEARLAVVEADRHFETKAEQIAQRAVQIERDRAAHEMLTILALPRDPQH